MSLERYFLINQMMDFAIVSAVARSLGRFRLTRILAASAAAAACAVTAATIGLSGPGLVPLHLAVLAGMAALAADAVSPRALASAGIALICVTATAGAAAGAARAAGLSVPLFLTAGVGGAALGGLRTGIVRSGAFRRTVHLNIVYQGRSARLEALVDTGNRLREPLSGQPVVIAETDRLKEVMPMRGFRSVAYGAVGSSGVMRCFKPDRLYLSDGTQTRRAPEAWIALYPGHLPGGLQALAPGEFAID